MNTQEQANPQDAAKAIWDTLDAEDNGSKSSEALSNNAAIDQANPVVPAAPADKADAHAANEEAVKPDVQALLDKIAGLETNFNQVTQRLRSAEGHIGGLNNQLKQTRQPANQTEAPTAKQVSDARKDPAAMAELKTNFPEFASAISAVLTEQRTELEQLLTQARDPAQVQGPSVRPEDLIDLQNKMMVEARHSGWQNTVVQPEFQGWLQRQPDEVQMLATSADPRHAIRLLDLHAEAKKPGTNQPDQRLAQAAAIPSGRQSTIRQKSTDQMTEKEYWAYLDELDRNKKG